MPTTHRDGHVTPDRVEWPEDGGPAAFIDLLTCLERAFHAGANGRAKSGLQQHGVPWTGPARGGFETAMPLDWQLGPYGMARTYGNGRTFLTSVLSVALQLGMEQGARQERRAIQNGVRSLALSAETLRGTIRQLEHRVMPQQEDGTDASDEGATGASGAHRTTPSVAGEPEIHQA